MRRFDKKANIAEANRLADEAFMREREMMGIPSPKDEASSPAQQAAIAISMKEKGVEPKSESVGEGEQTPSNIESAINLVVKDKVKGGIEEMGSSEISVLFETYEFSILVNCDVEVEEYPYYEPGGWNEPPEGSNGGLDVTITDGVLVYYDEDEEIRLTAEQLKPLTMMVGEVINDGENLHDYFEHNSNEPDYDDHGDDDRHFDGSVAAKEWGGMDEEINEIKRITKRLLGE